MRLTFLMGVVALSSPWGALAGFVMTDSNIHTAVNYWLSNSAAAEAAYGHISTWETGGVTDMYALFCGSTGSICNTAAASFNEDIGAWDTSGVTTMYAMFLQASAFNQDLGDWAVQSVTDMSWMFEFASAFDQDLGWCLDDGVKFDTTLQDAFSGTPCASTSCGVQQNAAGTCAPTPAPTPKFLADDTTIRTAVAAWLADATAAEATYGHISTWETGGVTDMAELFCDSPYFGSSCYNTGASSFNEDISAWDTSGVTTMRYMFYYASAFNQDIGDWAVHSVEKWGMNGMFNYASSFDQDLGWCGDDLYYGTFAGTQCASTSCGVNNMAALRCGGTMDDSNIRTAIYAWYQDATAAEATYGHISTWQTGGVTDMSELFCTKCSRSVPLVHWAFNDDISAWDTSGVTDMKEMFYKQRFFNQPIGKWKTSAVKDMDDMFSNAYLFNQDLSAGWDVGAVTRMGDMFKDAKAFDQDLGWCLDNDVGLIDAFLKTKCESTACGVAQKDVIGICDPWARPCLIRTKTQCIINSPTLIIIVVLALAGFGACVYWRKKKDETYFAAARRILYSCICCCCLCCRKKKEQSSVNSQLDSPAESPREEPDEEATDEEATAEKTEVEESVEPSSFSKLTSFLFGEREEAPTEEEAAALPVVSEAEEEATEQPPPPPARRWFSSAEHEPAAPKAEEMHQRMAGWYNNAPEAAALRAAWGEYPETPDALQAWPGFVAVTNTFLDASPSNP